MMYRFAIVVIALAWPGGGPVAAQTGAGNEAPTGENPRRPQECSAPEYLRQHWEQSRDAGRTWLTVFDGTYTRARAEE